jgi:hypothetical protein
MKDLYDFNVNSYLPNYESIYIKSGIGLNHDKLRKILNDDAEFDRLSDLVKAEHNCYGSQEEIYILDNLITVILTGIDSHCIDSIQSIKLLYFAVINRKGII